MLPERDGGAHTAPMALRRIAVIIYPNVECLDVTGPMEVFAAAQRHLSRRGRDDAYAPLVLSRQTAPVRGTSGITMLPDRSLDQAGDEEIHTLLVPGGPGVLAAAADAGLLDWLRQAAARAARVVSICTGAFLVAHAGLLDGRRATTHWASAALLAERFPAVDVRADQIYVRDGSVSSSGGVTAGIDLALALVEEDLGREVALEVARELVVFLRRPADQLEVSTQA